MLAYVYVKRWRPNNEAIIVANCRRRRCCVTFARGQYLTDPGGGRNTLHGYTEYMELLRWHQRIHARLRVFVLNHRQSRVAVNRVVARCTRAGNGPRNGPLVQGQFNRTTIFYWFKEVKLICACSIIKCSSVPAIASCSTKQQFLKDFSNICM